MTADVCVLIEGTYPYVAGGVSSWLHALITNLPDFTFTVLYIGTYPEPGREPKYSLPANVVELRHLFLRDPAWLEQVERPASRQSNGHFRDSKGTWRQLGEYHAELAAGTSRSADELLRCLIGCGPARESGALTTHQMMRSIESWSLLTDSYHARAPEAPFTDYYWTFRATHLPLFRVIEADVPPAKVYHSISTGYAGTLGALAKIRTGSPYLLTEHGVYNREREIEIAQARWETASAQAHRRVSSQPDIFDRWWLAMFKAMARVTYEMADRVISITGVNQRYQLRDGADPAKMSIIPNGIDVARFSVEDTPDGLRLRDGDRFVVGFVGRVVPIKDVKTFIRAISIAKGMIPGLVAYVVGPTDEDGAYFADCQVLSEKLGLSEVVIFTGRADVRDYYRQMDVCVLTSLSEAQPLVILEASCAGVPVVATNVGACQELLCGITSEDQALGPSGIITPAASPQETAKALVRLSRDQELWSRLAAAGRERVRRFYRQEDMYAAYRELYGHYARRQPVEVEKGAQSTWQG